MTKRELAAVLRESVFAPSKPGPLKVIMDVGDSRYYMQRALELVVLSLKSPTEQQKIDYLTQAITLLAVAKHTIRNVEFFQTVDEVKGFNVSGCLTGRTKHRKLTQKEIDMGG